MIWIDDLNIIAVPQLDSRRTLHPLAGCADGAVFAHTQHSDNAPTALRRMLSKHSQSASDAFKKKAF